MKLIRIIGFVALGFVSIAAVSYGRGFGGGGGGRGGNRGGGGGGYGGGGGGFGGGRNRW